MKKLTIVLCLLLVATTTQAKIKCIGPETNLRKAILSLASTDTLCLSSGNYRIDGTLAIRKNVVITSKGDARPVIELGTMSLKDGACLVSVSGVDLTLNGKYLIAFDKQSDVSMELISFNDCNINLGGESGASIVYSSSDNTVNTRIERLQITNSTIYNGGIPLHCIYSASSVSATTVNKIVMRNTTVVDTARGLIVSNNAMTTSIELDSCTFYNINRSQNNAGLIRLGNANASISVSSCIITCSGEVCKFIVAGEGSQVSIKDTYITNEVSKIANPHGIVKLIQSAKEIYTNPSDNPLGDGVSFAVNQDVAIGRVGDKRWY